MKIMLFSTSTCPVCPKAERVAREVMPDYPQVTFVKYKANKGEGKRISAHYMVMGVPTFLMLDDSGNEIKRIVGVPSENSLRKQVETQLGIRKSFFKRLFPA